MLNRKRQEPEKEKPIPDDVKQAIRRACATPDGAVLLEFLKARGGVELPTYKVNKPYEAMIHHGACKALVGEVLEILER